MLRERQLLAGPRPLPRRSLIARVMRKAWIDPLRPDDSVQSGHSAESLICALEHHKADARDRIQSANYRHSRAIVGGRSNVSSTFECCPLPCDERRAVKSQTQFIPMQSRGRPIVFAIKRVVENHFVFGTCHGVAGRVPPLRY